MPYSGPPLSPEHSDDNAMILVVDDEEAVRIGLGSLFRSVGLQVALFASAAQVLDFRFPDAPCCLVLDVRLRGPSGLELQARLNQLGIAIPIIFMTGFGDIPMTVAAMKAGAVDFMSKPIRDQDLLEAVGAALDYDRARRRGLSETEALRTSYSTLSPREREVMRLAVTGMLNKQIASQIGISEVTVKIHRGQAMRKMKARNYADLILMAQQIGLGKSGQ